MDRSHDRLDTIRRDAQLDSNRSAKAHAD